jgi:hypothetical protein
MGNAFLFRNIYTPPALKVARPLPIERIVEESRGGRRSLPGDFVERE